MRAVIITGPHRAVYRECETPKLAPHEVLVRVRAVGICKSDLEVWHGARPAPYVKYPVQLGHEWCGEIAELGAAVHHLRVGQRVAVAGLNFCGACFFCLRGETNLCAQYDEFGFTRPGGYAELVAARADLAYPFHDALAFEYAALCEPASCACHALERAAIQPGDSVVIIGPGTLGLLCAAWARIYQPAHIVVVGENRMNETLAYGMSATHYFTDDAELLEHIRALTEQRGADVVVEAAGSPRAFALALALARRGGTVVVEGIAGGGAQLSFQPDELVLQDARVHGVFSYAARHFEKTLRMLESGALPVAPLITHHFPLSEFQRAFDLLQTRAERVGKILLYPELLLQAARKEL